MASSGSGYDLSTATFSPDGRIFQVEYATKAVSNASTVLGIQAKDGIVLAASKAIVHAMVVPTTGSYKRLFSVAPHVGVAATGFTPDARVAVQVAVDEASAHDDNYDVPIPPSVLADRVGRYMHFFTLHGSLRSFGAAVVVAGYDEATQSTSLHLVEPNGAAAQYYGVAVGQGQQAAKTELEMLHRAGSLTCREATKHAAKILTMLHQENKNVSGKKMSMELSWICEESGFKHVGVPKEIVEEARTWAEAQLEEDDDEEMEEE